MLELQRGVKPNGQGSPSRRSGDDLRTHGRHFDELFRSPRTSPHCRWRSCSNHRAMERDCFAPSVSTWLLQDLGRHRYPVQQLPIKSGATHIGGFTPLAHGTPGFYTSSGELAVEYILPSSLLPVPFREEDNLPSATYLLPDGASR
jgi:hypothetical protein